MKFALVDNQRIEAEKGLKGVCPICHQPVIAKCGKYKINHWAHKSLTNCDTWWENETDWHRQWKNLFPENWQESVMVDEKTGEKHIADIRTDGGMIIEFQHSNISETEKISREQFYKTMVWIVDGNRRKNDFKRFKKGFEYGDITPINWNSLYIVNFGNDYFPKEWLNSSVPVLFDFKNVPLSKGETAYENDLRNSLWAILPIKGGDINVLIRTNRDIIIGMIKNGGFYYKYHEIINIVKRFLYERNIRRYYRW